ncbi:MAG: ParB N-terminal domain-containing protein [Pseudomonadota bacterium]
MAKRKRLSAPDVDRVVSPEVKSVPISDAPVGQVPAGALRRRAPIADVAGQAALADALERVSGELMTAKTEGRMVVKVPLAEIDEAHIIRDRTNVDPGEMEVLKASLAARGQQTPIEVVQLRAGRYGLISGWRRLTALRALVKEGQGPDYALALLRSPETASEAYTAMVEENEIRVGLSYYERASIVERAVGAGIFATPADALAALFASASRAKRSKIKSFLPLVEPASRHLKFPAALSERLGLALAARMADDATFFARLRDRLRKADRPDAATEMALIEKALAADSKPVQKVAGKGSSATPAPKNQEGFQVALRRANGKLTLSGPGLSDALVAEIEALVRNWQN